MKNRLEPINNENRLGPWRRATELTRCFLYWIPVRSFPLAVDEKLWLMAFFDRWNDICAKELGLQAETFLQIKVVQPNLSDTLVKSSFDLNPVFGLSRRPGSEPPPLPSSEDVTAMQRGEKKFSFNEYVGDYCYWFLDSDEKRKRTYFFGHGGLTTAYLKMKPAPQVPKVKLPKPLREHPFFRNVDVAAKMQSANRLSDPFLAKSKELFGIGLEKSSYYEGLLFVLPLLSSGDFFSQPEDEVKKWFDLFDIYVVESPADKGIVLATKTDLEGKLEQLVADMKAQGLKYPS